ncbi:MAG: hypothetical protein R2681_00820 [Pyrinomonadaceae bacterium]
MRKLILLLAAIIIALSACSGTGDSGPSSPDGRNKTEMSNSGIEDGVENQNVESTNAGAEQPPASGSQPSDVRGFFMKLPNEYFVIESCEEFRKTSLCEKAKARYLKDFTIVEDLKNGYLEAGGDGAQTAMKMAIFKRPEGTYLIGLNVFGEGQDTYKFLEYSNGKWQDISLEVVPEYSSTNIYELPRQGTTVSVFAKKIIEQGKDFEESEKGEKLYDLTWADGKFSIQR